MNSLIIITVPLMLLLMYSKFGHKVWLLMLACFISYLESHKKSPFLKYQKCSNAAVSAITEILHYQSNRFTVSDRKYLVSFTQILLQLRVLKKTAMPHSGPDFQIRFRF